MHWHLLKGLLLRSRSPFNRKVRLFSEKRERGLSMSVKKILDHFEERCLYVFLPVMVIIIFVATVGRYTKMFSLPWSEELSRYLMIWMAFIGIGLAAKNGRHFAVDLIFLLTPTKIHKAIKTSAIVAVVIFLVIMLRLSVQFTYRVYMMGQLSPAMYLPMWFVCSAIPLGFLLMLIRSVQFYVFEMRKKDDGAADDLEQRSEL